MDLVEYQLHTTATLLEELLTDKPDIIQEYCKQSGEAVSQIQNISGFLIGFATWWHYSNHAGSMQDWKPLHKLPEDNGD